MPNYKVVTSDDLEIVTLRIDEGDRPQRGDELVIEGGRYEVLRVEWVLNPRLGYDQSHVAHRRMAVTAVDETAMEKVLKLERYAAEMAVKEESDGEGDYE